MTQTEDQTYQDAAFRTIGHALAEMFKGLVDGGMSRAEALMIVRAYATTLAGMLTNKGDQDA